MTEPPSIPSPQAPRGPAILIGLMVATIASAACVYVGYDAAKGGCDGGVCLIPKLFGWVAALVAWPIVFAVVWGIVRRANRA